MQKPLVTFSDGSPVPLDGKYHVDPLNPLRSIKYLEPWQPPGVTRIFAGGNTARVGLLSDGTVLKFVFDKDNNHAHKCLEIEHHILSTLGKHERLASYIGKHPHGLQFHFAQNKDIRQYISSHEGDSIPLNLRQKWAKQAAQAVSFVHSKGVIHCDIHPNNFLLDENLNIRLCDFSGSMFEQLDGQGLESTRFFLPRDPLTTPTIRTDLFALASTIYYIMCDEEPYKELSDDDVIARFARAEFPDVSTIPDGDAIKACWTGTFRNAKELELALLQNNGKQDLGSC
jgi:serine/threonine protein kinase